MEPVVYGSVVLKPVVIEPVPMDIDNDVRALLAYGERHQQFDQAVHGRRRQFAGMTWSYDNRLVRQTLRVEKGKDRNQNQAASVWAGLVAFFLNCFLALGAVLGCYILSDLWSKAEANSTSYSDD